MVLECNTRGSASGRHKAWKTRRDARKAPSHVPSDRTGVHNAGEPLSVMALELLVTTTPFHNGSRRMAKYPSAGRLDYSSVSKHCCLVKCPRITCSISLNYRIIDNA